MFHLSRAAFPGIKTSSAPPFHTLIFCALLAGAWHANATESASAAHARQSHDVSAGSLERALAEFAAACGTALSFDPVLVAGKTSPGLHGNYSVLDGFALLLEGSGLELVPQDGGYTLRRRSPPERSLAPARLPEIVVRSPPEEANAWTAVDGFVAKRSATATKTDTPINETSQSISVVTRDQMDAQGARTVEQALRYTPGVITEGLGHDQGVQYTTIRGFRAGFYRDGVKSFASTEYNDWVAEPWALERVEVLKGPASVMYGQNEPGGIVNLVSKRPVAATIREAQMLVGNHDRYQVAMDVGGQANDEGSLLYRVIGLARESKTQAEYGRDDRVFLAPSVAIKASSATTLTLMSDLTQDRLMPIDRAANYVHALMPGAPMDLFLGEPGLDRYDRDLASLGYLLEHDFGDDLSFRQTMRYSYSKHDYRQHTIVSQTGPRTLSRAFRTDISRSHATVLDSNLQKNLVIGDLFHKLLIGVDYQKSSHNGTATMRHASSINVDNPVYGIPPGALAGPPKIQDVGLRQTGLYLQDQMRLGKWLGNIGLRYDNAKTRQEFSTPHDKAMTYNAGLMYVADNGVSSYISYATSFNPSIYAGESNLKPETGEQIEVGVKYQPANSNSLVTVSLFNLRKQNVPVIRTEDPVIDGPGISIAAAPGNPNLLQIGEVQSRGLEFEVKSSLNQQWDLIGSYTYLDAEITQDTLVLDIGRQLAGTARNTAAIWLDYHFADEALHGWTLGGGLRYHDGIACFYLPGCFNSGQVLADAALRYQRGSTSFALNINNFFDKTGHADGALYTPLRTIQATLTYNW